MRLASTLGLLILAALGVCVPMLHADCGAVCRPVRRVAPPVLTSAPVVFTAPFEPLDVFVFVGVPVAPAPALVGQGGTAPSETIQGNPPGAQAGEPLAAGFPKARSYFGQPAPAVAGGVDVRAVAAALTSCTGCHTAPSGKRGVNIFAASGAFDPKVSPRAIYESVKDDSMPLRGAKLTPVQKNLLANWVAAGEKK